MSERWSITPEWQQLETGSPEERACFAALSLHAYDACLTLGHDRLSQSIRLAPFLSAYHLAEWLAWNWWRLRWEPHKNSTEWELSHGMASIGEGYIWPNIRFVSDGQAITLESRPTSERERTPYRYISNSINVIAAADFEREVDLFIETVLQRLQTCEVADSNLQEIWQGVRRERQDPALTTLRKLEALLGEDPGEMDEDLLENFRSNANVTGQAALEEIAADRIPGRAVPDIAQMLRQGHEQGIVTNPKDRARLSTLLSGDADAAWKVGTCAARLLRAQEKIDAGTAISNEGLATMYGASRDILTHAEPIELRSDLSFALAESERRDRVVLRSKWNTGRRFELARLLGDSLTCATQEPLRPATRSDTYRQKVQRAFAAELLSPFEAVDEMLDGDYSMESQQDVAHHFQVSDLTIRTLLVNHRRIDRSALDESGLTCA